MLKQLSGLDATFLYLETPETPMHVGALHLYDLPEGYEGDFCGRVRRHIARRVHLVPLFRRRLAAMPLEVANPVWVEDDKVDLEHHVRRLTLPRPGTLAQLETCVARLHSTLLDRSRPLWVFYVIDGLKSGQIGLYTKIHHAALDGAAGVALANALLDVTPVPRRVPKPLRRPGAVPGLGARVGAAFRNTAAQYVKLARHLPDVVKLLAEMARSGKRAASQGHSPVPGGFAFGPKTPLNVAITGERGFATASIPLDEVKAIARAHDVKLNDVVLALASGALRRYLADHGGVPRKPLIAAMPVSLREAGNTDYNTQATLTRVALATQLADPVKRLRAISGAAGAAKALTSRMKPVLPTDFPSLGVPWLLSAAAQLYGRSKLADVIPPIANVVISNVPGPEVPLYLAGARMRTYWPVSIVEHGVGLNITVQSYCGSLDFGFTVCRKAVPDVRRLARALIAAHRDLRQVTQRTAGHAGIRRRHA